MAKLKPTADMWIAKANLYISVRNNIGKNIKAQELTKNSWNLPSANWYVINTPFPEIKTYNDFVIWCGFVPNVHITKEQATKIILEMQSNLNRPITASDFSHPKTGQIGIRTIINIWGEVWKMQSELGLKTTGKHARSMSVSDCKESLLRLCSELYAKENRRTITYKDIINCTYLRYPSTCTRLLKEDKTYIKRFLKENNFDLQKEGNGFNYTFTDGEKIKSWYEYEFSKFLRSNKLKYNVDYFRDVKYRTFTSIGTNIDCDYQIKFGGRLFYVELAGMLSKKQYAESYKRNIVITTSKSKELYRKTLNTKRELFEKNGLEHYILLPDEINENIFKSILRMS